MKERITLQEIVAMNNTPKAKALIVKYGYSPAKNYDDLIYKLFRFTKEYNQEALEELAEIHPHKDLILNFNSKTEAPKDIKSNFNGDENECQCSGCKRNRAISNSYSNAEGKGSDSKGTIVDFMPMMLMAGLISAVLITAIKTAN